MKVGVIGNGGREHALCSSLKNSHKIKQIYCFPGNAGTDSIAKNVNINLTDFELLKDFIIQNTPTIQKCISPPPNKTKTIQHFSFCFSIKFP